MTETTEHAVAVAAQLLGDRARRDAPLGALTTYRVGGCAALLLEVGSTTDLDLASSAVRESGVDALVVGRGSNLLVADAGFRGLVLMLGEAFAGIDLRQSGVRAGAAVALPVLARRTAAAALTGLEWGVGVPGSVGGAVRMNAGGHGAEVRDSLVTATVFDLGAGAEITIAAGDLDLGYRRSALTDRQVVTAAEFELRAGERGVSEALIADIVKWRRENQPGGQNAGSVFTNPPGDSAGRIIDAAGLRGLRVRSARVSERHANFFQADDGGSADDVAALIREVARRVEEAMGVRLVPEVHLVGFE